MHKWVKGAFGSQHSLFVLLFWFQRCKWIFAEADRQRAQPEPSSARTARACWQHTRRAEAGLGRGAGAGHTTPKGLSTWGQRGHQAVGPAALLWRVGASLSSRPWVGNPGALCCAGGDSRGRCCAWHRAATIATPTAGCAARSRCQAPRFHY